MRGSVVILNTNRRIGGRVKGRRCWDGGSDCVFRTLIRFNEIQPDFLNNAKILAATLYLNQTGRLKEGEAALNETTACFAVKKDWEEGNQVNGVASPGAGVLAGDAGPGRVHGVSPDAGAKLRGL